MKKDNWIFQTFYSPLCADGHLRPNNYRLKTNLNDKCRQKFTIEILKIKLIYVFFQKLSKSLHIKKLLSNLKIFLATPWTKEFQPLYQPSSE